MTQPDPEIKTIRNDHPGTPRPTYSGTRPTTPATKPRTAQEHYDQCSCYAAGREAASPSALDVERLAKAMKAAGMWPSYPNWADPALETAEKIAAEYARLSQSAGEPGDGGEGTA